MLYTFYVFHFSYTYTENMLNCDMAAVYVNRPGIESLEFGCIFFFRRQIASLTYDLYTYLTFFCSIEILYAKNLLVWSPSFRFVTCLYFIAFINIWCSASNNNSHNFLFLCQHSFKSNKFDIYRGGKICMYLCMCIYLVPLI